jgi:mono/diheme cytochrome c family protein
MNQHRSLHYAYYRVISTILLLLIIPLLIGCGNLSGEPEIVRTFPTPMHIDNDSSPIDVPDLGLGKTLFAENCIPCHGTVGKGDGELVRSGQVPNPGDFTKVATAADQSPLDYFRTVTNGRLGSLMPPWGERLSEIERWAVAMYAYVLHYQSGELNANSDTALLTALADHYGDLAEPQSLINVSDSEMLDLLESTNPDVSDEVAHTIVANARAKLFGADAMINALEQQSETTQQQDEETVTLSGQIENGTAGGVVPENVTVQLDIFENETLEDATTFATDVISDGDATAGYEFTDIPVRPEALYLVSVNYQGRNFATPFQVASGQTTVEIPVTIYEATTDTSVVSIDRIIIEILGTGDVLEMRYEFVVSNDSDHMLISDETLADGRQIAMEFPLPPASVFVPDGTERFYFDEQDFVVYDTRALLPGEEQSIRFLALVPYQQAAIIEFPVVYSLDGQAIVILSTDSLAITSEQLIPIDQEAAGIEAKAYGNNVNLQPGELLRFEVHGNIPAFGTSTDNAVTTSDSLLPILLGGGLVILLLLVTAFWFARRSGNAGQPDARIRALVREIEQLDAEHEAGQINHDLYRQQRAELQAELDAAIDGS